MSSGGLSPIKDGPVSPGGVSPIRSDVPISSSSSTISSSSSGRVSPFKPLPTSGLPTLKICGVPEHFNLPWTLGMKKGVFEGVVDVLWTPMPGGTGAMVSAVADGTVDVAVALTEGIVAAVLASNSSPVPLRYAGSYVASPLRWMIVAACDCEGAPRELEELRVRALQGGTIRVSVSRLGSGSHLMAYLLALREGWPLSSLVFTEDKNFRSMRKALSESTADIFMWEKFMTKPFVDQGELRVLGYLDSPWHCFGFLARKEWLETRGNREVLHRAVSLVLQEATDFLSDINASCNDINAHFDIPLRDALAWMSTVRYPAPSAALVSPAPMLRLVLRVLVAAGLVVDKTTAPANAPSCGYALDSEVVDPCVALKEGKAPPGAEEATPDGKPAPPTFDAAPAAATPSASSGGGGGGFKSVGTSKRDGFAQPWWWSLVPSIGVTKDQVGVGGQHKQQHPSHPHLTPIRAPSPGHGSTDASFTSMPSPIPLLNDAYTSRLTGLDLTKLNVAHRLLTTSSSTSSFPPSSSSSSSSSSIDEGLKDIGENRVLPAPHLMPVSDGRTEAERAAWKAEKAAALALVRGHLVDFGGVVVEDRRGGGGGGVVRGRSGGQGGGEERPHPIPFHAVSSVVAGGGRSRGGTMDNSHAPKGLDLPWHTKAGMSVDFG